MSAVYSLTKNSLTQEYGLPLWQATDRLKELYQDVTTDVIDLMHTAYVLGHEKFVIWAFSQPDYTDRVADGKIRRQAFIGGYFDCNQFLSDKKYLIFYTECDLMTLISYNAGLTGGLIYFSGNA